mgnify:CR=1 FL=1|jgi:hypothetical protein
MKKVCYNIEGGSYKNESKKYKGSEVNEYIM